VNTLKFVTGIKYSKQMAKLQTKCQFKIEIFSSPHCSASFILHRLAWNDKV